MPMKSSGATFSPEGLLHRISASRPLRRNVRAWTIGCHLQFECAGDCRLPQILQQRRSVSEDRLLAECGLHIRGQVSKRIELTFRDRTRFLIDDAERADGLAVGGPDRHAGVEAKPEIARPNGLSANAGCRRASSSTNGQSRCRMVWRPQSPGDPSSVRFRPPICPGTVKASWRRPAPRSVLCGPAAHLGVPSRCLFNRRRIA